MLAKRKWSLLVAMVSSAADVGAVLDSNSAVFQSDLFFRQRRSVHAYALQHWIE
jgi:hypothetical protein